MPTAIGSLYVSANLPKGAGAGLHGFAKVNRKGFRNFVGSVYMSDDDWTKPKIVVKDFFFTELGAFSGGSDSADQASFVKKLCSQIIWKEDVDHLTQEHAQVVLETSIENFEEVVSNSADFEKAARIYLSNALSLLSHDDEAAVAPHLTHFIQWARHRILITNASTDESEHDHNLLETISSKGIDGQLLAL